MSKIKIESKSISIEFDGTEEFIKDELPNLIELLHSFDNINGFIDEDDVEVDEIETITDTPKIKLTTNSISAKLNVKSATDLVLASSAHITLVKGNTSFTRSNILAEMKLANNYYKTSMRQNLSNTLKALVKNGSLLETATDTYSLHATKLSELEEKLDAN